MVRGLGTVRVAVLTGATGVLGLLGASPAVGGGKPNQGPPPDPAIAFVSSRSSGTWNYKELKVMDADGSDTTVILSRRTRIGETVPRMGAPDWSPDGLSLVLQLEGGIHTVKRDGSSLQLIVSSPVWPDVAWSPVAVPGTLGGDRVRIAFMSPSLTDLFLADPDGSDAVQVTDTTDVGEARPTWSPSGTRIAVEQYKSDSSASGRTLGLYDFETDTRTEIAPGGDLDGAVIIEPSWSRTDERRIAVRASIGTGLPDIWILDLDDLDNPVNVTNTPTVAESFPCWSPDDSRIAFNAGGFGTGAVTIQVMNADGTGRATLSNEGAYPAWRR